MRPDENKKDDVALPRTESPARAMPRAESPAPRIPRRIFLQGSLAGVATLGGVTAASAGSHGASHGAARPSAAAVSTLSRQRSRVPSTIHEKVGQLFMVSFGGTTPRSDLLSFFDRNAPGGVILYERNVTSAAQVRTLIADLQRAAPVPLLVATDEEGGLIASIRDGVAVSLSEARYGALGSPARVYHDATTMAHGLGALGLTMDLAPVVDILADPHSPIGTRSYGADPRLVGRLSVAAIQGYQRQGLAATAKHFVGLGRSSIDSHHALPTVTLTLDELERGDLIPFRAAIAAGVSTVMVAHVALPAIDPVARPASLSPVVMEGLLRRQLGFTGVIMTDSLVMGAIPGGNEPRVAEQAFAAGADMLLISADRDIATAVFDEAVERIVASVTAARIPESRLDASVARIMALKRRYPTRAR